MKKIIISGAAVAALVSMVACSAEEAADEAPETTATELDVHAMITSVNAAGTWTADARSPTVTSSTPDTISASAVFTGPAGATRRMGVCSLRVLNTVGCNTVADCASAPAILPAGGFRYCTQPEGWSSKRCAYRQGSPSNYCAGTPALGGAQVAPGTYASPSKPSDAAEADYVSYACFEGCSATDPSVSSATQFVRNSTFGQWGGSKK